MLTFHVGRHSSLQDTVRHPIAICATVLIGTLSSETSTNTLSFALVLLALHPEVQQKVYEEAMRVWPDGEDPLTDIYSSVRFFRPSVQSLSVLKHDFEAFQRRLPEICTSYFQFSPMFSMSVMKLISL